MYQMRMADGGFHVGGLLPDAQSEIRNPKSAISAILVLIALLAPVQAFPQSLKPLLWGADAEGGAPYEFQDPRNPSRVIGFEVEIIDAIGRILDRPTRFVQNQWDGLVPGLERGNYDLIVSGLEITPDRARVINFSRPYYVTYEQLAVRADDSRISSLEDCRGRKVGTLKGSLAQRMLEARADQTVLSYDGQINAYEDLSNGRLDAVLMDYIIALYNVGPIPGLKMAGTPIGQLEYGIGVRKEDAALLEQINSALAQMISSGELRRILENWKLWTPMCAEFFGDSPRVSGRADAYQSYMESRMQGGTAWEKIKAYLRYLPLLGRGAIVTLELSLIAMALAVVFGLNLALARLYAPRLLRAATTVYIESIRGTPLLIQLFLIFYGLPHIGIRLSPMLAAIIGLGLNYSAYEAENYRAGLQSIPKTQMEAALALGMTRIQALRFVIVPQAMRLVIPPVTNDFIALLKDSSLVSVITMVELTKAYSQLASIHYDYLGIGLLAAGMYFLIGLPFVRLARLAERYFAPEQKILTIGGKQRQAD
ncbi:MAG TPA: ABC transporter substrate-binding protein/permease [Acidobacteriota bacterium]|nr:ABC transporter substrate-binding protein/permease [Acidobacteriota bacterium]